MSRIPEVIDLDVQIGRLNMMFGGNMDFDHVRGKCGGEFLSVTDARMCAPDGSLRSPNKGVEDLKKFFTAFANIRNKIGQLERDGFNLAAHEARTALEQPDYRMLGETHPFLETIPITLVMFHPETTLQVLARIHGTGTHWCKIEEIPEGLHIPSYRRSGEVIFYKELLRSLEEINEPMREKLKGTSRTHIHHRKLMESVLLPNEFTKQSTKIGHGLGCVCYATKDKILRQFTKKEQEQIAIWEFHLPKTYAGRKEHQIYFGLHLIAEHAYWTSKKEPFCSTNTLHGYGAVAYPGEAYHRFDKRSKRFKGTRILLCN